MKLNSNKKIRFFCENSSTTSAGFWVRLGNMKFKNTVQIFLKHIAASMIKTRREEVQTSIKKHCKNEVIVILTLKIPKADVELHTGVFSLSKNDPCKADSAFASRLNLAAYIHTQCTSVLLVPCIIRMCVFTAFR